MHTCTHKPYQSFARSLSSPHPHPTETFLTNSPSLFLISIGLRVLSLLFKTWRSLCSKRDVVTIKIKYWFLSYHFYSTFFHLAIFFSQILLHSLTVWMIKLHKFWLMFRCRCLLFIALEKQFIILVSTSKILSTNSNIFILYSNVPEKGKNRKSWHCAMQSI